MRRPRNGGVKRFRDIEDHMKPPEALDSGERDINSSLYRSAVICLDMLKDFKERDRWMHRWEAEHPQDPKVAQQKEYLRKKWGGI